MQDDARVDVEPKPEYYTVVYQVTGGKLVHDKWWQSLRPIFLERNLPVSIVTIAKGDLVNVGAE